MSKDAKQIPLHNYFSRHRSVFLMLADFIIISMCYISTWGMLLGRISVVAYKPIWFSSGLIFVAIFLLIFRVFGMYDSLWRYAETYEFLKCCLASLCSIFIFLVITLIIYRSPRLPISVYFISSLFASSMTLYYRMFYRVYRSAKLGHKPGAGQKKVLLVGAGNAASSVLSELHKTGEGRFFVVCAVDDDMDKVGRRIQRVKIEGTTNDIPQIVEKYGINLIIVALPSASQRDKKRILSICSKTRCTLRIVPDVLTAMTGDESIVSHIRDVNVEDLLGRDVITISAHTTQLITGKTVLVTGGGGSIGSELCRQIAAQNPKRLVILDIYENNAYSIQQELVRRYGEKLDLRVEICSVRDEEKIDLLFDHYRPDIVFHAAAHKHVPLMEACPEEAIKNNIFGTLNVARCADKYHTAKFVMISTDKAVNPTNIMGATKRVCEMIVQSMNTRSDTHFSAVRFGNVLGSNGSVIPLFKEQIANGGPVTVTHPDIVRYFMTIPEAVSLVLKAGEMVGGGEIFVLDMGEPVRIKDLAENLIRLSGFEPETEIAITYTGLRPGEKLFEELLLSEEGLEKTENEKIFVGKPTVMNPDKVFESLEELKPVVLANQTEEAVRRLHELVPTFHSPSKEETVL
ncbi:polysaccharide biosynthesis protein [Acetanaerobacterium elongatum]|uniref:NDP-sugar epimerase, includes UDP-GlcNAc-inverting 4,6-dehydratase FlaA1 and capsular polysaccharide biosynthesis protein EpsC n=1 Tax=Acetanaerobacterium elongatum TaxID=258515 RepID=A0A1G9XX61_9FIRM|nr:nucleoside-diphosphate sugar epimerase/dehydratase [Acetanaerobacterium elongatum]SDN01367.1 NDP-sugar epimerase, includes UDP-GlcNAc-inverting 4,6-dehydratase FlaA1 and capsular polysaccharide biosynthesis protein EpsC [Acetanaerobacterium elongatum]